MIFSHGELLWLVWRCIGILVNKKNKKNLVLGLRNLKNNYTFALAETNTQGVTYNIQQRTPKIKMLVW